VPHTNGARSLLLLSLLLIHGLGLSHDEHPVGYLLQTMCVVRALMGPTLSGSCVLFSEYAAGWRTRK
jgi:hypothetical protein